MFRRIFLICLLGLGCLPAAALGDSSGVQYSDAPSTATGRPDAHSGAVAAPSQSGAGGGASESSAGASAAAAGSGGAGSQGPTGGSSSSGPAAGDNAPADAKSARDARAGKAKGPVNVEAPPHAKHSTDSGLLPVLIVIGAALLFALSALFFWLRHRRGRADRGAPTRPGVPTA